MQILARSVHAHTMRNSWVSHTKNNVAVLVNGPSKIPSLNDFYRFLGPIGALWRPMIHISTPSCATQHFSSRCKTWKPKAAPDPITRFWGTMGCLKGDSHGMVILQIIRQGSYGAATAQSRHKHRNGSGAKHRKTTFLNHRISDSMPLVCYYTWPLRFYHALRVTLWASKKQRNKQTNKQINK